MATPQHSSKKRGRPPKVAAAEASPKQRSAQPPAQPPAPPGRGSCAAAAVWCVVPVSIPRTSPCHATDFQASMPPIRAGGARDLSALSALAAPSRSRSQPSRPGRLLAAARWVLHRADARWAIYTKTLDNEIIELKVPQLEPRIDYARAVRFLLEDLARLEQRPAMRELHDVQHLTVRAPCSAKDIRPHAEPDES